MAKKKYNEKQQLGYLLYMETSKTQKECAGIVGVSEKTFGDWVEKFGWKEEKGANHVTPDKLKSRFLVMIADFEEKLRSEKRFATPAEADALLKISAAVERLDKKITPSIIMNVFMRFNDWLSLVDPKLASSLTEYQIQFVQTTLKGD